MPERERNFFLNYRSKFIYWFPSARKTLVTKSGKHCGKHMVIVDNCQGIKKKKFKTPVPDMIPIFMKKAEKYLLEEAEKYHIPLEELAREFSPKVQKLRQDYDQIVGKAKLVFEKNQNDW